MVGCEIQPASIIKTQITPQEKQCALGQTPDTFQEIIPNEANDMYFTYAVHWKQSNVSKNKDCVLVSYVKVFYRQINIFHFYKLGSVGFSLGCVFANE